MSARRSSKKRAANRTKALKPPERPELGAAQEVKPSEDEATKVVAATPSVDSDASETSEPVQGPEAAGGLATDEVGAEQTAEQSPPASVEGPVDEEPEVEPPTGDSDSDPVPGPQEELPFDVPDAELVDEPVSEPLEVRSDGTELVVDVVEEPQPESTVEEPQPESTVEEPQPESTVEEQGRDVVDTPEAAPVADESGSAQPTEPDPESATTIATDAAPEGDDLQPHPGQGAPAATSKRAWRRLGRAAAPRPTKANVLATLLALGLGFAIAAQVRQTSLEGLEDLREDELIRILDTVDQDGTRLAEEIQTLRRSRDRLKSDTTSLTEARKAAQQRLDSLAILTGTAPAKGPGIVLTIQDPEFGVTAPMLLDTLQELRDAGAEAVEINHVRIVANTYFTDSEGGISISGTPVSAPYVITAIGDGSTLASAMEIPGGVTNTVRSVGGEAVVETEDEVTVSALRTVSEPQYARPIPSPTTS